MTNDCCPASQASQSNSQLNMIDLEVTSEQALLKERLEAAQKEVSQLANQLQLTENKLETQLQEAKEERLAERKEREGYQMLMMKFQHSRAAELFSYRFKCVSCITLTRCNLSKVNFIIVLE